MTTGMLWFDNDANSSIREKVNRAMEYYEDKYGEKPNRCFVHPSTIAAKNENVPTEVKTSRIMLPNHFWVGVEDEKVN